MSANRDFDFNTIADFNNGEEFNVWNEGLDVEIKVAFNDECEFNFCQLFKNLNEHKGTFTLKGEVGHDETVLTGSMPRFNFEAEYALDHVVIKMIIKHEEGIRMEFGGEFVVIAEDGTSLLIDSEVIFDQPILRLEGKMTGVYEDVFKSHFIDMADVNLQTEVTNRGVVRNIMLNSYGIVGRGHCYQDENLVDSLAYQVLGEEDFVLQIGDAVGEDVPIINDEKCATGDFTFKPHDANFELNDYEGILHFDNIQKALSTLLTLEGGDKTIGLINKIKFPEGLTMTYSHKDARDLKPVELRGPARFLGLNTEVVMLVDTHAESAELYLQVPPFKLGGGNLRFNGMEVELEETSLVKQFHQENADEILFRDHSQPNVIQAQFEAGTLQDS